jgi:hypothetical protein
MHKPLTPKRIFIRDRRMAAIHEAGHVIMGRHIGLAVTTAWLENTMSLGADEKLWTGHTKYIPPEVLHRNITIVVRSGRCR